jgi:hypothetical protein
MISLSQKFHMPKKKDMGYTKKRRKIHAKKHERKNGQVSKE